MQYTEPYWKIDQHCDNQSKTAGGTGGTTWVRIGPYQLNYGANNPESREALGQDGTVFAGPGTVYPKQKGDQFFWETLSQDNKKPPYFHKWRPSNPPGITGGTSVTAATIVDRAHNRWLFTISYRRSSSTEVRSFYQHAPAAKNLLIDQSQADFELERQPNFSGYKPYPPLGKFGDWAPGKISANGNVKGQSNGFSSYNERIVNAQNSQKVSGGKDGQYLATAALTRSGFHVKFRHC